jgi:hypothetical protein
MSKNLCNSSSDVWADCLEFCKSSSVVWANCSELCFCLACLSLNWLSLRVKHLALEAIFVFRVVIAVVSVNIFDLTAILSQKLLLILYL